MSVDAVLGVTLEPLMEPARLPTGDWLQDQAQIFRQPLWVEQASEVPARLSPELTSGLFALITGFPDGRQHELGARLLELSGWATLSTFHVAMTESLDPVEQGFFRRLRFWTSTAAPTQAASVAEVVRRFVSSEEARIGDAEMWLRGALSRKPPPGWMYEHLDYPTFDSGSGDVGFATLFHGPELHVWSRFVHHHK